MSMTTCPLGERIIDVRAYSGLRAAADAVTSPCRVTAPHSAVPLSLPASCENATRNRKYPHSPDSLNCVRPSYTGA